MNKSNIFALIELSKLVEALKKEAGKVNLKSQLLRQSSHFNVIDPKYFSENLVDEWTSLQKDVSIKGIKRDEEGFVVMNAVRHTIEGFSEQECAEIVNRIQHLYDKVQVEFQ
jgi:hypothetical protein